MPSSSSEQHIKDAMTMSHAQRKATLDELMKMLGKSVTQINLTKQHGWLFQGENLSTEEHAITTSQILLTRAGLSADKYYPREGDDKNTIDLNKVVISIQESQLALR